MSHVLKAFSEPKIWKASGALTVVLPATIPVDEGQLHVWLEVCDYVQLCCCDVLLFSLP